MKQTVITAELREKTGKGENRRLRREGLIPGILYGKGTETLSLTFPARQIQQVAAGEGSKLLTLQIPGQAERSVVLKDTQYDFLYKNIRHVDLQEVSLTQRLTVSVPVVIIGEDARKTDGGVVQQQLHELEVECLPTNIPEQLHVDVSELGIGKSVTVGGLNPGEGIQIKTSPEEVVVHISAPSKAEAEEEPSEAAETESGEETAKENA